MYKATFDRVAQLFSKEPYTGEFNVAREDYFRRTGKVFQDDPIFEVRMTAFLEWYVLDRLLWDSGVPPVRLYRLKYKETLEEPEVRILEGLEKSVHSLFLLTGRDRDRYVIEDFRTKVRHHVSERHAIPGVHRGDILDARIVKIGGEVFFSDAVWIHPSDAAPFLEAESRKKREGDLDSWHAFLFDLAYMKLKRERFAHVPTAQIYDWALFARDRAETERRSTDLTAGGTG
jgi:hypothetical protein